MEENNVANMLSGLLGNTIEKYGKAVDRLDVARRVSFCQWLTNMSLTHNKTPETILDVFDKSMQVILKRIDGKNAKNKNKRPRV